MRNFSARMACAAAAAALFGQPAWKEKPVSEWSQDDARQVLTDSPWAKSAAAKWTPSSGQSRGARDSMGRSGGWPGVGGVGIGGMGMPRAGRRAGGLSGPATLPPPGTTSKSYGQPPPLTVRWESALPVQEAELKAGNSNAPSVDEDHYSIIVLGIPSRLVRGDGAADAGRLQPHAEIRREGGKPIKSSSARILVRDEGPVVVFQFPRSEEIPARLKQVEFQGRIGPLEVDQVFPLADMIFAGKLEL